MKIAITVSDAVHVANAGGELQRETAIIEIADDKLPPLVRRYLEAKGRGEPCYQSMSFSLVEQD
jgi:hypothetical protein